MKLYFSPGASSLACHIALREALLPFELERVHLPSKTTAAGADYLTVNAKGQVPALLLDDGNLLTENAAVLQYIGDRGEGLVPPAGSMARYRAQEWLSFIGSEVHKNFGPLYRGAEGATRQMFVDLLATKMRHVEAALTRRDWLLGSFGIADCYAFAVLRWTAEVDISLAETPAVAAFLRRVAARPTAQAALQAEGIEA